MLPTWGAAECTPIRGGPQANVRRREHPPRRNNSPSPPSLSPLFGRARRNPSGDPRRRLSAKATFNNGTNKRGLSVGNTLPQGIQVFAGPRPSCSIRGPPAPSSAGPSKKETGRQVAPDTQHAVQRAGRSPQGIQVFAGPRPSCSIRGPPAPSSAGPPKKETAAGRWRPTPSTLSREPAAAHDGDRTTSLGEVRRTYNREGKGRMLRTLPGGQRNAHPSEGDRRPTLLPQPQGIQVFAGPRPSCSIRGPPAPSSAGPSKKETGRQVAPDTQHAVQRAGRSPQGIQVFAGPRPSCSIRGPPAPSSAGPSKKETGRQVAPDTQHAVQRAGRSGAVSPLSHDGDRTTSLGEANVRRREHPPRRKNSPSSPSLSPLFGRARRNPSGDPRRRLSAKATFNNGPSKKETGRQVAPDTQHAVQRAGRSPQGIQVFAGPRPSCSIRGPPAPSSAGPSKKETGRQVAPDTQHAVQRAGRS
ncbi:collagen alpha-1(I) chain-like, partial [Moschus berezovskii]|uniref:collagen alpha-1(I) chain-like n=1 Tax=Moschus berezovskii TaxID=68408 RepID=UPI002443D782